MLQVDRVKMTCEAYHSRSGVASVRFASRMIPDGASSCEDTETFAPSSFVKPAPVCVGLSRVQVGHSVYARTVYSAALRVVGMAICLRVGPPVSFCKLYRIAFEASMGEPPPTETMISAPESFISCIPFLMPAMGECCPIS